jgi:Methyltransferase domain
MVNRMVEAGHLGGYQPGGDPNTHCPELWRWFVDELGIWSVIDVGCGDGAALDAFAELVGSENVLGVEGVPQDHARIVCHDYTTGPYVPDREFDLCWSAEFVEHVEEEFVPNFLATFTAASYVAMTHGVPDQPGYHHVNCRPSEYWETWLKQVGFVLLSDVTEAAKRMCAPESYFAKTGMIFARC